jgi:hypothetical protein
MKIGDRVQLKTTFSKPGTKPKHGQLYGKAETTMGGNSLWFVLLDYDDQFYDELKTHFVSILACHQDGLEPEKAKP